MPSKKSPPAQVIKADKGLQEKAGIGDIDQKKSAACTTIYGEYVC